MKVSGKAAVVTGGGSGIGRSIALALARRNCRVVVADIEQASAAAVVREIEAMGGEAVAETCDTSSYDAVERLAERAWGTYGRIDLIFNNAGVSGGGPVLDARPQDVAWVMSVNFTGVWNGCAVFGKRFRDQTSESHIVITGSEHSIGMQHAGAGIYTASKHAVLGLSDVLRKELPSHIGVSILCPGLVQSNIWHSTRNRPADLGGPQDPATLGRPKAILAEGMEPDEIGRRAVDGVERRDFFIFTHPHSQTAAKRRWEEIDAAFAAQAPYVPGSEKYDVNTVVQRVMNAQGEAEK
jgi:NAD(P)-dependent dehydrogenase (short-subunit alcohol dehydrogenase family)